MEEHQLKEENRDVDFTEHNIVITVEPSFFPPKIVYVIKSVNNG